MENRMMTALKTRNKKLPYDQPSHHWAYTEKTIIEKSHVPLCSLQHYLQEPGHGSNLDVCQQMNG